MHPLPEASRDGRLVSPGQSRTFRRRTGQAPDYLLWPVIELSNLWGQDSRHRDPAAGRKNCLFTANFSGVQNNQQIEVVKRSLLFGWIVRPIECFVFKCIDLLKT